MDDLHHYSVFQDYNEKKRSIYLYGRYRPPSASSALNIQFSFLVVMVDLFNDQLMDISHHNGRNSDIIFILMSNKMTQTFCLSQQTEQRLVCSSGSILVFQHLGVHIRQLFAHRLVIVYRLNDSQGNESLLSCHSCDSFLNLISHLGHGVLTELTEMSLNFISGQIKVSYLFTHFNSC